MSTALDIISEAYRIAGILGNNETANSWQADQGLIALNDMLDIYGIDRSLIFTITQSTLTAVSGQITYTIGTGGDLNITRPPTIDSMVYQLNGVNFPMQQINNQDYNTIPWPTGGFPQYYYYDAAFPLATLKVNGQPTTGGSFLVDTWTPIQTFTSLTTNLTYPPGYQVMIKYNLAKYLAGRNGMALTPSDEQLAVETMALVKGRNLPSYVMKTEVGLIGNNNSYHAWWP